MTTVAALECDDVTEEGALATTRGPHETQAFPSINGKRHVLEDPLRPVADSHGRDFDDGVHGARMVHGMPTLRKTMAARASMMITRVMDVTTERVVSWPRLMLSEAIARPNVVATSPIVIPNTAALPRPNQ